MTIELLALDRCSWQQLAEDPAGFATAQRVTLEAYFRELGGKA
jgi:hypothetical protein